MISSEGTLTHVQFQRRLKPRWCSTALPPLGSLEMIEFIRHLIDKLETPSWVGSVPPRFGSPAAGKLKADEWRWLFTLYIPIALILRWGPGSTHASLQVEQDFRRALDHTMLLVQAMIIAVKRYTSDGRATAYLQLYAEYVEGLKNLYPGTRATPSHHAAFHIYDFLKLFGPIFAWWAFPFERVIGRLQRIPKNHKKGEFMMRVYVVANA